LIQAKAIVASNTELIPGTFLLALTAPEIAKIARPGQFIMADCGDEFTLRRPISIYNCTAGGQIHILVRVCGAGTDSLSHKKKDDIIDILGPCGNGFKIDPKAVNVLLIAGGIGIAPIHFLANLCHTEKKQVTLLKGAGTADQLYTAERLPRKLVTVTSTDDGSAGYGGKITDLAAKYLPSADQVFACGPVPMYVTLTEILKSTRPRGSFQVSVETRMGCGFGICYGCTIKTTSGIKQVCTDGPVFNIEEIDWEWLKIR
jgi:dihydroorotate dehydrogenase electron transfer subunit